MGFVSIRLALELNWSLDWEKGEREEIFTCMGVNELCFDVVKYLGELLIREEDQGDFEEKTSCL